MKYHIIQYCLDNKLKVIVFYRNFLMYSSFGIVGIVNIFQKEVLYNYVLTIVSLILAISSTYKCQ